MYRRFKNKKRPQRKLDTSWQGVAKWYNESVGEKGLYFHQKIIFPKSLKLLGLTLESKILDLACGQGIFSKQIPEGAEYLGLDLSEDLISFAKRNNSSPKIEFDTKDVSSNLDCDKNSFSHAICILALQNIEHFDSVIKNASNVLQDNGKFLIVLNHPYFRIPHQTSWEIDNASKIQYRRIDRYYSPLRIPINMNPGKSSKNSSSQKLTWSFHHSLEDYSESFRQNNFVIEKIEEWVSDKTSQGPAAKMENRAREEFPMFMAILLRKQIKS